MNQSNLLPLIRNLGQRTQEFLGHEFEFLGLGPGQIKTLTQIMAFPGTHQGELARQLKMDKSTISRAIRVLVGAGFVEKRANRHDQKTQSLWATKLATAFAQQMNSIVEDAESVIVTSLTEEETAQFQKHLKQASDNLERHLIKRRALLATEAHPSIERI